MLIETYPKRRCTGDTCKLHVAVHRSLIAYAAGSRRHVLLVYADIYLGCGGCRRKRGRRVNKPPGLPWRQLPRGPGDVLGSTMRAPMGGVVRACRL